MGEMAEKKVRLDHIAETMIPVNAFLRDAMQAIDDGSIGIALVVDACDQLVGTVTDGDIRRALLGGATLDSPLQTYMRREFTTIGPSVGRAEVLDLMRAR